MITRFDTPAKCWEKPSDGFPDGFKALAKTIKSYGLHPGIWLSPDIYFVEHTDALRDVLCRLPNGKQVYGGWQKNVLDMSDYTVTNYYVPLFKTIKDSGFEYVKIDSLRHVLFDALLRAYKSDEAKRRFRNLCLAARLTFGDDVYLLSCLGVIPEILGSFDACRITIDCNESWVSHHYQLYYFAEFFPLNRVLAQVIAIREKLPFPQFLASDRHVSMDAVSVENIVWKGNNLCLKLNLVSGSTTTYSFYVPDGYSLKKAFMEKGKAEIIPGEKGEDGQVINVLVKAEESSDSLTLAF